MKPLIELSLHVIKRHSRDSGPHTLYVLWCNVESEDGGDNDNDGDKAEMTKNTFQKSSQTFHFIAPASRLLLHTTHRLFDDWKPCYFNEKCSINY